jgi:ketosteroid isomerase-like protein
MSQANVEVVKVAYEVFARAGLDRFMEHFTDDVDYRTVEGAPDDRGPITAGTLCGPGSRTGSTCSTGSGWSWWN